MRRQYKHDFNYGPISYMSYSHDWIILKLNICYFTIFYEFYLKFFFSEIQLLHFFNEYTKKKGTIC